MGDALARTDIRLISYQRVAAVLESGGRVVGVAVADGRKLEADRVVLAAGAWSGQMSGTPRAIPVRPVRGQIARYPARALGLERVVASHAGKYLVPRGDGTVLAGSTMEEVGYDRSITEDGLRAVHEAVTRLVPAVANLEPLERWAGLRPIAIDSWPLIGPDPDLAGLLYATGYGRDGILIAPLAGAIVADLAVTGRSEFDARPFRPDRFAE